MWGSVVNAADLANATIHIPTGHQATQANPSSNTKNTMTQSIPPSLPPLDATSRRHRSAMGFKSAECGLAEWTPSVLD